MASLFKFKASETSGVVPIIVQFTDTSTEIPNSWAWSFGGDATSIDQNPVHTFTTSGTYTVTLTITNYLGNDTTSEVVKAQYTITFDSAGGSPVDDMTLDPGSTITAPTDPTQDGYNFDGWDPELPDTMPAEDLTVTAKWKIDISSAIVTVDPAAVLTYTGNEIKPGVSVTFNGDPFYATNYNASYANNIDAGNATVTVTGIGNYSGSATGTFEITKAVLPSGAVTITVNPAAVLIYTGFAIEPGVTQVKIGEDVIDSSLYVVSYENNTATGTARAIVTFDNYTETSETIFEITKAQLTKPAADTTEFTFNGGEQNYKPNGATDKMTVTGDKRTYVGFQAITISIKDKANHEWADRHQISPSF